MKLLEVVKCPLSGPVPALGDGVKVVGDSFIALRKLDKGDGRTHYELAEIDLTVTGKRDGFDVTVRMRKECPPS